MAATGLEKLLGGVIFDQLVERELDITAMEPVYVRRKAGHSATAAYRIQTSNGPTWGYAHQECDPLRADDRWRKALSLRPRPATFGEGVVRLDRSTIFYGLPNDQRLRRLRWFVSGRKLKRSLEAALGTEHLISGHRTTVDILRYKPERRLVIGADVVFDDRSRRRLVVRYATSARANELAIGARHLRRSGVSVPQPVAQIEGGRVGIDEHIDGSLLIDAVRAGTIPADEVAEALVTLHRSPTIDELTSRNVGTELARAEIALDDLVGLAPGLNGRCRRLGDRLAGRRPSIDRPAVFLHGDLHPKNAIITQNGATLIDLDRMAAGPPEVDLGTLLAHAVAIGHRRPGWSPNAETHTRTVIECYRSRGGDIDGRALRWFTAVGLVELALLVARHVEPGWLMVAERLVDCAAELLD